MDFSGDMPVTRSAAVIAHLKKKRALGKGSKVLDYGCHRGAFLALLSGRGHAGYDVSEQYRPVVEGLGFSYYTPDRTPPAKKFDLLTLIHVFEHLENPSSAMNDGIRALKDNGKIAIQVPDPVTQPTDLYVMDHFSHFSPRSLQKSAFRLGVRALEPPRRLLAGEWTALFERGGSRPPAGRNTAPSAFRSIRESLARGEERLLKVKKSRLPCALYGAGLLGSMVARFLKGQVKYFIDDSPQLRKAGPEGLPVHSPDSLPGDPGLILITVPPSASARVQSKCLARGWNARTVFNFFRAS